jgi:hypothetical protein
VLRGVRGNYATLSGFICFGFLCFCFLFLLSVLLHYLCVKVSSFFKGRSFGIWLLDLAGGELRNKGARLAGGLGACLFASRVAFCHTEVIGGGFLSD